MRGDEILDKLLQLLPVHLQQRLADGDPHRDGGRVPYPVDCQRHHVQAPEDVAAAAAAGHTRDLAPAVELGQYQLPFNSPGCCIVLGVPQSYLTPSFADQHFPSRKCLQQQL